MTNVNKSYICVLEEQIVEICAIFPDSFEKVVNS